jgi:hypothetical protein
LNRDGLDDVLIGAQAADPTPLGDAGEVYLINGCYVVSDSQLLPLGFSIRQNYPNPFNPATTIAYTLPRRARVRMDVFDVSGAVVATLIDAEQEAGDHVAGWDGRDVTGAEAASGVYFCKLRANEASASIKLVLLR